PSDAAARYELFAAVTALLCRAAATEPLLVVLEDVHWADEATLALLEFAAQEIDGSRLLLLLTYRDRERSARPRALAEAVRHGQRIALRGLDRAAVARLVADFAGGNAAPELAERLADVTGGNPFFLVEVLRALQQEGRLDAPPSARELLLLPDTVRDSIRRHLEPIAEADRELLSIAAVAGDDVEVRLLAQATCTDAATVLERLNAAVERGFVVERGEGRFRFAHALVRETIYGDLLPAARVHLHARVGEALESLHGSQGKQQPSRASDDGVPLGALARHFLNAGPLGTGAKAVHYAKRAARHATALFAFHDALAFYEQALAAIGADPAEREERMRLRLDAAGAAIRAGLDQRGCELLLLGARDARARGDRDGLLRAALGYYLLRPNLSERDPETRPLLEEALAAFGGDDSHGRALLLALLSTVREDEGSGANDAMGEEAVAMARRLGDPQVLSSALLARHLVVVGPESPRVRLTLADEAVALIERGAAANEHLARGARVHCLLELGGIAEAKSEIERMARAADRLKEPVRQWQVLVRRAAVALLEGRFDDGARIATEALAIRRNAGDPAVLQHFVLQMFLARREPEHRGGLEGSIRWLVEQTPESSTWSCVLAVFLADSSRIDETREVFERIAAGGFARLAREKNAPALLAWMARVATFLWDEPRARELYPLLLPYADRNIVLGASSQACLGSAHRYLGLLAATCGDVAGAERHYRDAIAMNERMAARPVVACTQHEYARLLQYRNAPGDRTKARLLIEQARATSLVCGMSQLIGWIDRLGPVEAEATAPDAISGWSAVHPVPDVADTNAARAPAPPSVAEPAVAVLRRDGDVWQVGFGSEVARMKDARGVHLLAVLLQHPGQEIHVLDLAAGGPGAGGEAQVADRGDAGPLLDQAARSAYRRCLDDLREQLEEAESFNDPVRAERARHEMEFLAGELSRGVGLGGRDRRAASAAERARVNATRTIGGVVKKIASLSPRLGEHLRGTVRTGYFCVYAPDPTSLVRWQLER
ncbi:hypothetical protein K2Z84_25630, partial [Candidatus Binatia bacterium]|nr:hypothetical protein [Candidatus Binatia bacterium]